MATLNIELDAETESRLKELSVRDGTATEALASRLLAQAARSTREIAETRLLQEIDEGWSAESDRQERKPVNHRIQRLSQLITDTELVTRAIRAASREAVLEHKRAGNPVAIWRDGKSVVIPPEEIVLPEDPDAPAG